MQYKDYYTILGVDKSATQDEIKKAYRKLAKQHHPDVNKGNKASEDKFKEASEAYEVLGDAEKRKKYDTFGAQAQFNNGYDFDPSQYGYSDGNTRYEYSGTGDHSDFFNMFFSDAFDLNDLFAQSRGGGGGRRVYNNGDFTDAFGQSRGGTRAPRVRNGQDVEAEIELVPEEGAAGTEKRISLQTESGTRSINFKVPAGVSDGETIRLKGQGHAGMNGGKNGDLRMTVRMKPGRFTLKGQELVMHTDVYPWDAALGTKLTVDTLDGRIAVKIPAGVTSGSRIRVTGKGYPFRSSKRGDLYLVVRIVNPATLSPEQKELYEKLKETVQ